MDHIFRKKVTCAWQLFLAMGPAERVQGTAGLLGNNYASCNSVNVCLICTVVRMQPMCRRDAYG